MAAARVFNTYELTEAILLCLPLDTLILSTSITSAFRSVVCSSQPIRNYILAALSTTCTDPRTRAAFDDSQERRGNSEFLWIPFGCGYLLMARGNDDDDEVFLLMPSKTRHATVMGQYRRLVRFRYMNRVIWRMSWFNAGGSQVLEVDFDPFHADDFCRHLQRRYGGRGGGNLRMVDASAMPVVGNRWRPAVKGGQASLAKSWLYI